MKQAILKTTEPRPKSNQTLFIKMLIFTCSRLSQRQLLFMRLHVFDLARLHCGGGGGGVHAPPETTAAVMNGGLLCS